MKRLILAAAIALTTAPMASAQNTTMPWPGQTAIRVQYPYAQQLPVGFACGAHRLQSYIGQPLSDAQTAGVASGARIMRPGMITNMMYVADRLNIHVDGDEIIWRLSCG